ncbi:MAG: hypothetical protein J6X40_04715 [Bacteroidales bacterium]|nr:hypothetical protein [Bacteroidales bacterium]
MSKVFFLVIFFDIALAQPHVSVPPDFIAQKIDIEVTIALAFAPEEREMDILLEKTAKYYSG